MPTLTSRGLVLVMVAATGCGTTAPADGSAKTTASPAKTTANATTSAPPAESAAPSATETASAPASSASASASTHITKPPNVRGCPCGCDHSESMAADLRQTGGKGALEAIDESLRTIADREAQGYVTEAMIQHRLRLLSLGRELGRERADGFQHLPPLSEDAFTATNDTITVRGEMFAHGDAVEFVSGREKTLVPSFVVRLHIENRSAHEVLLATPSFDTHAKLDVSRWYIAGGDGTPYDGRVPARGDVSVNVIGYVQGAVPPGTTLRAPLRVGPVTLPVETRARAHWNEPFSG